MGAPVISRLEKLPNGVIGCEASGKISAEDYRDAVLPALTHAAEAGEVRFLLVVRDFDGMSGGAFWEDLKVGAGHLRKWKRVALVTDVEWMAHVTSLFGWVTPGETRTFPLADRDRALAWAAG
ncbi:SpoIIAA family protein [Streptomyces hydrogenans]|uniref:STAS/SEC14 domain-containing protein n=1 Tax=Streptomyces hydrogenans TaxID=1873719 RepID=UPI00380A697D